MNGDDSSRTRESLLEELGDLRERLAEAERAQGTSHRDDVEWKAETQVCRALFRAMSHGVLYQDAVGLIALANPAAESMLGQSMAELQGRRPWDPGWQVVDRDGAPLAETQHPVAIALRTGQPVVRELVGVHPFVDGPCRWLCITAIPHIAAGADRPDGVYSIFDDVTDQLEAEARQRKLEVRVQRAHQLESLGLLAGGIAHDFNNLLVGVLGYAELALMDLPPGSPVRSAIESIGDSARRAAELTQQLVAYSGKGRFAVEPLDLSAFIEKTAHLLEVSVERQAVLQLNLSPPGPVVDADPNQVRQVLTNLALNAAESIVDPGGVITVSTGVVRCERQYLSETFLDDELPPGLYAYVDVTDTGAGMDAATQAKVFDPFFTTKFKGRGLGLAAVLGIVRGHRGAIRVHSEPGKGTSVKLLLPQSQRHPQAVVGVPSSTTDWTGRGLVLVIDDEVTVRAVARKMVKRLGFDVAVASDGVEGVQLYRQLQGDVVLVLLDMTMREMDGEATFRELKRIRSDVVVVLISGYTEAQAIGQFPVEGLAGFLQKPFRLHKMREKIRAVLDP